MRRALAAPIRQPGRQDHLYVGYRLYREVRDLAPADLSLGELAVAWVIADDATHWQPPGGAWPAIFDDPVNRAHLEASEAARERLKAYTRLYTRQGSVAHLSPPWGGKDDTLCPVVPKSGEWLGTGSQSEYELAAELETCPKCRKAFMDSQRCGNPECPCQNWDALPSTLIKASGGDR